MQLRDLSPDDHHTIEQILGYLNFSSGAFSSPFFAQCNELVARISPPEDLPSGLESSIPVWQRVIDLLQAELEELRRTNSTFEQSDQAAEALQLVGQHIIPGYLTFHRDLLFHQDEDLLIGPFMLGRVFETLLRQPRPWDDPKQITDHCIQQLNQFLGHRPVPTLESQKIEPHPHEWVRPIPVYVEGAGVAHCRFQPIIAKAIDVLRTLDDDLQTASYFHFDHLEELAIDPRAYDFEHPANRRPNHHFGEWDPQRIDNRGFYRRFVVREVTVKALMDRVEKCACAEMPADQLLDEAAAVLAGTILMASGISGSGPDTHDSTTTLMMLVNRVAAYRDAYYERLLLQAPSPHRERLQQESIALRQPFGGARQNLNTTISLLRAGQIEHVKLATIFAQMGYLDAAQRQIDAVPVASARMLCRIDCSITAGRQAICQHDRESVLHELDHIVDLLQRGIVCGAIVDPWNILGFDGNFSLFPALENSIRDHRIDELIRVMDRIFDLFSRAWSDCAATDDQAAAEAIEQRFEALANWWHTFAAHEVPSVNAPSALTEFNAARQVSIALSCWHREGANTDDVSFWAPFVDSFDSPKAYALVIDTLMDRSDLISSMSLLIHWISQRERVGLGRGHHSFHRISNQWVRNVALGGFRRMSRPGSEDETAIELEIPRQQAWTFLRQFFDRLEANADTYWEAPRFELSGPTDDPELGELAGEADDADDGDLFGAAYENVVFQDSTDDGFDGSVFDSDSGPSDEELTREAQRIAAHLGFLQVLAKMWNTASIAVGSSDLSDFPDDQLQPIVDKFQDWCQHALRIRQALVALVDRIQSQSIPTPTGNQESMMDYDRHRHAKDSLVERVVQSAVEVSQCEQFLRASLEVLSGTPSLVDELATGGEIDEQMNCEMILSARFMAAALQRNRELAHQRCEEILIDLPNKTLLYIPIAKGGNAHQMTIVRMRLRMIKDLLVALPRLGLLEQSRRLIDTAREMELNMPEGRGAVTQFDELFEVGYREMVHCLVRSTEPDGEGNSQIPDADAVLIGFLEQLTESILQIWLEHSRTLRISVLERTRHSNTWNELVQFIQDFGSDLFSQQFLNLRMIRAILHCGVDEWLSQIEDSGVDPPFRLIEELDKSIPRKNAVALMTLTLEAIVESFDEYLDYNTTTTQSDHGENLYMLLDFLRLQSAYDRVAWNLRPIVISHEILLRRERNEAAQLWRRALSERVGEEANSYIKKLNQLQTKYAMRMASVSNRLSQSFLRPMTIDRMRALVQPAIDQLTKDKSNHCFEILEEEATILMREPTGSGLDASAWLLALEEEIERLRPWSAFADSGVEEKLLMRPIRLTLDEVQTQLDALP